MVSAITTFGLPPPSEVPLESVSQKLQGTRGLCVALDGRPGFEQSLIRAGFPKEGFGLYFEELKVHAGRNSNLIKVLEGKAKSFEHLLYAWGDGLRTLPPSVKRTYSGVRFEAATSLEVVLLLKRWILGD